MRTGLLMSSLLLIACGASNAPLAMAPPVAPTAPADQLQMRTPDTLSRSPGPALGQLELVPVTPKQSRERTLTRADHEAQRGRRAR